MEISLPATLSTPHLNVMNFLNEVAGWYPSAISFAPGRPFQDHIDVPGTLDKLNTYVHYAAEQQTISPTGLLRQLGQYHKTNGVINELVCRFLANDERIKVPPQAVMITDGGQEAMLVVVAGVFDTSRDVLLVADPTYIGITGIATLLGLEMALVPNHDHGLDLDALQQIIAGIRSQGKNPKGLYVIPDFNNPLGSSMPLDERYRLLEIAAEHQMLLIEDNPYGMFAYDGPPAPTLKSLDREGVVIYLGTLSKIVFPGLRIGFLVADQLVSAPGRSPIYLAQELSKVKSLTTVNTSPLLQGMAAGLLLEENCSLRRLVNSKLDFYRANRDLMLDKLNQHFNGDPLLRGRVSWNTPQGGYFLTVTLPFDFTNEHLTICAERYGVLCCPLTYFSLQPGREHQIRLSFSYVSQQQISEGIARLWQFVHDQVVEHGS